MSDLTPQKILERYKREVYGNFANRGLTPEAAQDIADLHMLRALEKSSGWRSGQQEALAKINGVIDRIVGCKTKPIGDGPPPAPVPPPGEGAPRENTPPQASPPNPKQDKDEERKKPEVRPQGQFSEPGKALYWPENVSRYSGTGISYGWNSDYIDALINGFNAGAQTQRGAHRVAANELRDRDVVLDEAGAESLNSRMLSELSESEKEFFKPIEPGIYPQIPVQSPQARSNRLGPDSRVLIVVGADRKGDPLRFKETSERLATTLKERFGIIATVLVEPSERELAKALASLGGGERARHAAVYFIAHGSARQVAPDDPRRNTSSGSQGSIWLSQEGDTSFSLREDTLRRMMRPLTDSTEAVDLVVSACHSQAWVN